MKKLVLSVSLLALLCPAWALAQDQGGEIPRFQFGFSEFISGKDKARLTLIPNINLDLLEATCDRGGAGKALVFKKKNVKAGKEVNFTWKQKTGRVTYACMLRHIDNVGLESRSEDPLEFTITKVVDLKVKLEPNSDIDLEAGTLTFTATNPVAEAHLQLFDEDQKLIQEVILGTEEGLTGPITLSWEPSEKLAYLDLKITDVGTFWWQTRLIPYFIGIQPDDNPQFETNSADLRPEEEAKLQEPLALIQEQLEKCEPFGCLESVRLYIGGYTDTVGNNADNLDLSQRRAHTIAKYFKGQGIEIPILYQGFGESALLVQTGDGVDEVRNRRAYYVITNARPHTQNFPRQNWKRLK